MKKTAMIQSMTGYAAQSLSFEGGVLHMELKSVNSRFLDMHFRLADELRPYEMPVREKISARIGRGKVECRLYYSLNQGSLQNVNTSLLAGLQALEAQVHAQLPGAKPLSVYEILRWPGVLGEQSIDFASLGSVVATLAELVLEDFVASRVREGEKLAQVILERACRMREIVIEVEPLVPAAQAAFVEKLQQRLHEALGSADDSRILQEATLFAARIDVEEELARLKTHLDELERVTHKGGAVGKRLDFLMQELNREANTLGSKSAVTEMSQAAMRLKLLIENIREQVQNLE